MIKNYIPLKTILIFAIIGDLMFTVEIQEPFGLGADHRRRVDPDAIELLQLQGTSGAVFSLRGLRR